MQVDHVIHLNDTLYTCILLHVYINITSMQSTVCGYQADTLHSTAYHAWANLRLRVRIKFLTYVTEIRSHSATLCSHGWSWFSHMVDVAGNVPTITLVYKQLTVLHDVRIKVRTTCTQPLYSMFVVCIMVYMHP